MCERRVCGPRALTLWLLVALAGCGGGGGSGASVPTPATATPAASPVAVATALVCAAIAPSPLKTNSVTVTVNGARVAASGVTSPSQATGCAVTFQAPVGSDAIVVSGYASTDGSGTPLYSESGTVTVTAGQTAQANFPPVYAVTALTVTISPTTAVIGTPSNSTFLISPMDAIGEVVPLAQSQTVSSTISGGGGHVAVTTVGLFGLSGTIHYDGVGSAPASLVATLGNVSITTAFLFNPVQDVWVITSDSGVTVPGTETSSYYVGGQAAPIWTAPIAFPVVDAVGNVWGSATSPSGSNQLLVYNSAGTQLASVPFADTPLVFSTADNLYALASSGGSPINAINVYAVGSGYALTKIRSLAVPSIPCSFAIDASGTAYVATCSSKAQVGQSLYKYPSGSVLYTDVVSGASNVRVDGVGNVYALLGGSVVKWPAGTALTSTPTPLAIAADTFGVTPVGDVCGIKYASGTTPSASLTGAFVGVNAKGSTVAVCPAINPIYVYPNDGSNGSGNVITTVVQ
jgi:hypothetical protein